VVKVAVGWGGQFEGSEADVIQGFVVNTEGLVCVLHKLVYREGSIVGFNNGITDFGGGHDRV